MTQNTFSSLPDDFQQALFLVQQQKNIEVFPLEELKGGRTGALLFLVCVSRSHERRIDHLILKLDRTHPRISMTESDKHKVVCKKAPLNFVRNHIPEILFDVTSGDVLAIFYTIAGQSMLSFRSLASFEQQEHLELIFEKTNTVLLDEWNPEPNIEPGVHPISMLERWLGYRITTGGNLDRFQREILHIPETCERIVLRDRVYPNPIYFCHNVEAWEGVRNLDGFSGFCHGDLNITNVLVRFSEEAVDCAGIYLIDFALFKEQMPLCFDQHYLEMSYLIREMGKVDFEKWLKLVTKYAEEDLPSSQKAPVELAGVCSVINHGRMDFSRWLQSSHASLSDDLWGQFWLAGVAAGLNYCNKVMLSNQERIGALLFAAAHLKRFCTQFDIRLAGEVYPLPDLNNLEEESSDYRYLVGGIGDLNELEAGVHNTPLIGRQEELQEISALLENQRLVTLTGPGGIGKTRLSLAIMDAKKDLYRDGAFFVPLLSLNSSAAIISAIANVIDLNFIEGRRPLDQLLDYLRGLHMLLVLDNLEHLLGEATNEDTLRLVERMIVKCPQITVLVTSRELLRLPQEQVYFLQGLSYDDRESSVVSPEESAVTLFLARAREAQTEVHAFDEASLNQIRRICRLVDGLPLAIELAAVQLRMLTPGEIFSELNKSLAVLDTGLSGTGSRHSSMNAVFETSWMRLNSQEKLMFARLSGFRGSFTLQAANQIAQIKVQTLRQLVDRSLIQRQTPGRFCLHPLVHMFAAEKLQGMPEEKVDLHERHYGYFRDLLHQVIQVWWEKSDLQVMDQLRPDSDNLIAAWEWILGQERWVEVANYLEDLWQFYKVQGRLPEVMELLDQTFRVGQSASPEVDALQLAYWRRRIGQAYLWMSQLQQGEENFRVVVSLVDRPLPSGRFGYLMRILYQVLIQLRHRVLPSLVRSSNKKMRDRYHEAFIAYEQMAERAVVESKNLLFLYCILRSLNLSEITGERALMARAYATTGFAVSLLGLNMVTEYYLGKARQMIKGESSLKSQELVFRFSGFYYGAQGDHINAEKFLLLAANLAGELGQNWIQETNWTVLLFLALLRGDFEKALYFTQRIRTSARKRGDTGFEAAANYWEAAVRIEQNRCEEAILLLGEAEEAPPEVMNILDWVIVHTAFAQAYLRRGKTVSALDEAEKAAQIFCQVVRPSNGLLLLGNYYQADVYLRLWENEPDRIAQQKLRISARHTCHILEEFTNVFPSGKPRAFLYRGLLDWLEGNRRKAYRAWHKSLSIGERLDSLFDQGLAHYEIGRHLPPGEFSSSGKAGIQHLEQAREIFLKIGATYYLDQVDLVIEEIEHPASSP